MLVYVQPSLPVDTTLSKARPLKRGNPGHTILQFKAPWLHPTVLRRENTGLTHAQFSPTPGAPDTQDPLLPHSPPPGAASPKEFWAQLLHSYALPRRHPPLHCSRLHDDLLAQHDWLSLCLTVRTAYPFLFTSTTMVFTHQLFSGLYVLRSGFTAMNRRDTNLRLQSLHWSTRRQKVHGIQKLQGIL